MPKISKIRTPASPPKKAGPMPGGDSGMFHCSYCGRGRSKQQGFFPASQSFLYRGNGGYLTICNSCIDDLFMYYKKMLGDERDAIYRLCLKFDIYWNQDVYSMLNKTLVNQSRIRAYISKTNLIKYLGKTFDDTLSEELTMSLVKSGGVHDGVSDVEMNESDGGDRDSVITGPIQDDETPLDLSIIEFWGYGYPKSFYLDLDARFKKWTVDLPKPVDNAVELLYKNICLLECVINRDSAAGRPIDKNVNTLNTLLGSANLKPSQRKQDDIDASFDGLPFGVGIRMYENRRPIPEPDPDLQDVDGIVKYISIWFLGHLCKMLGIKNSYCKLYEQELEKLRIDRPELAEEEDEVLFNDIFGDESSE